jgi:hypothetical protein
MGVKIFDTGRRASSGDAVAAGRVCRRLRQEAVARRLVRGEAAVPAVDGPGDVYNLRALPADSRDGAALTARDLAG